VLALADLLRGVVAGVFLPAPSVRRRGRPPPPRFPRRRGAGTRSATHLGQVGFAGERLPEEGGGGDADGADAAVEERSVGCFRVQISSTYAAVIFIQAAAVRVVIVPAAGGCSTGWTMTTIGLLDRAGRGTWPITLNCES
jgi:hypothetical protein